MMNPIKNLQARIPVIVGAGEVCERGGDLLKSSEPLSLMQQALLLAEQDTGAPMLPMLDSLDIVAELSWPYADACGLLSARLGIKPRRAVYGEIGGESPLRFIHEAALRIARGESRIAAVVGAEAAYAVASALKNGVSLPWTPGDPQAGDLNLRDRVHPLAFRHGVTMPMQVYPFYENAAQALWGQTQRQALAESGRLYSQFSQAAARNPNAWLQRIFTPAEITTPSARNRLIAWPYTKHVIANPRVNQGAAVLITSLRTALEMGVAKDRLIYIWGGAAASESRDYLQRDQYQRSHAQEAALRAAVGLIEEEDATATFDFIELYSCFPCVPKMARRALALTEDARLSVAGGMSFFGAPLNNYMTHAAASLVRSLRSKADSFALLYGQGEFVTRHHALVLSSRPNPAPMMDAYNVDAIANAERADVPRLRLEYRGRAALETYTIIYRRDGEPEFGTVIARTPAGERLMARVAADDTETLRRLTDLDTQPIGVEGHVEATADGLLAWQSSRS